MIDCRQEKEQDCTLVRPVLSDLIRAHTCYRACSSLDVSRRPVGQGVPEFAVHRSSLNVLTRFRKKPGLETLILVLRTEISTSYHKTSLSSRPAWLYFKHTQWDSVSNKKPKPTNKHKRFRKSDEESRFLYCEVDTEAAGVQIPALQGCRQRCVRPHISISGCQVWRLTCVFLGPQNKERRTAETLTWICVTIFIVVTQYPPGSN